MAKLLLVAACAVVDRDGRVLLARRPEGKAMAGLWEFPGGKIADGETPEQALIRELKEEIGIETGRIMSGAHSVRIMRFRGLSFIDATVRMPKMEGNAGGEGTSGLEMGASGKLVDFEMPPADRPLAAQLRDFL